MFCYCSEEDDDIVSSGPGIEREVMYTVYHQFEMAAEQWFMPRADNLATLATSHSIATARYVPAARLSDLSILGAIVAILLIHGIAVGFKYFYYLLICSNSSSLSKGHSAS